MRKFQVYIKSDSSFLSVPKIAKMLIGSYKLLILVNNCSKIFKWRNIFMRRPNHHKKWSTSHNK